MVLSQSLFSGNQSKRGHYKRGSTRTLCSGKQPRGARPPRYPSNRPSSQDERLADKAAPARIPGWFL